MDIAVRLATLKQWYEIYDDFIAGIGLACGRGCAACCTCNVTATTLEGLMVYDDLVATERPEVLNQKISEAPEARFQPAITLNQMVEMCVHDLKIPEETNDPGAGACQWLGHQLCPIYAVRPFGCRAMCSVVDCRSAAEAQMPPLVLSVNNVMMQFIEALDRPGSSGNLSDILLFLSQKESYQSYVGGGDPKFPPPLKPNLAFQVLMVPPEHRQEVGPFIEAIQKVVR